MEEDLERSTSLTDLDKVSYEEDEMPSNSTVISRYERGAPLDDGEQQQLAIASSE